MICCNSISHIRNFLKIHIKTFVLTNRTHFVTVNFNCCQPIQTNILTNLLKCLVKICLKVLQVILRYKVTVNNFVLKLKHLKCLRKSPMRLNLTFLPFSLYVITPNVSNHNLEAFESPQIH